MFIFFTHPSAKDHWELDVPYWLGNSKSFTKPKGVEREGWFFPAARNPYVYGIQNWLSRGAQEGEKKKELGSAWTLRRQEIMRKRKKEIQVFGF